MYFMIYKIAAATCLLFSFISIYGQSTKTDVLIVGSDHLNAIYKSDKPATDVLTPKGQQQIAQFASFADNYKPELVMVEILPEDQAEIDSLYTLYLSDQLDLATLEAGRSEVYQLAFRIGKKMGHKRIYCVNAPGGTSQGILDNGENIAIYNEATTQLRKVVGRLYDSLGSG